MAEMNEFKVGDKVRYGEAICKIASLQGYAESDRCWINYECGKKACVLQKDLEPVFEHGEVVEVKGGKFSTRRYAMYLNGRHYCYSIDDEDDALYPWETPRRPKKTIEVPVSLVKEAKHFLKAEETFHADQRDFFKALCKAIGGCDE